MTRHVIGMPLTLAANNNTLSGAQEQEEKQDEEEAREIERCFVVGLKQQQQQPDPLARAAQHLTLPICIQRP